MDGEHHAGSGQGREEKALIDFMPVQHYQHRQPLSFPLPAQLPVLTAFLHQSGHIPPLTPWFGKSNSSLGYFMQASAPLLDQAACFIEFAPLGHACLNLAFDTRRENAIQERHDILIRLGSGSPANPDSFNLAQILS
jgi:hypothetical protein